MMCWQKNKKTKNPSIARNLQNLPIGHSDHFVSLRLLIQDRFGTVLSVHAPFMQAENRVKEACYRDLRNLLHVDSNEKLLTFGDFNA